MSKKKTPATTHFPTKLYEMICEAEEKKHAHIISWCPDGRSFRIHQPNNPMVPLLNTYFRQTKYKSFLRQLQGYNFNRITSGENKGNVSHPLFIRGMKNQCMQIKRKSNKLTVKPIPITKISTTKASAESNAIVINKNSDVTVQLPSNRCKDTEIIHMPTDQAKVTVSGVVNSNFVQRPTQPMQVESSTPIQPDTLEPRSDTLKAPQVMPSKWDIPHAPLQQLETNFKYTLNNSFVLDHNQQHQQEKVIKILPAPPVIQSMQRPKSTCMDALRMEIGCTFSPPKAKIRTSSDGTSSSLKRSTPHLSQHRVIQTSVSAPALNTARSMKRQRSHDGFEELKRGFHSDDMGQSSTHAFSSFPNASFSFSTFQPNTDKILEEEKMQFQREQQFARLERVCFSNMSLPSMQQFQHSVHSTSAIGTLDLDISLTTTTTTTNHQNGDSQVSSNQICSKIIFPSDLEPRPIRPPSRPETPAEQSDHLVLKMPMFNRTEDGEPLDCTSSSQATIEDCSEGAVTEVTDEVELGIAELFESDVEEDCNEEKEADDDWTKGIYFDMGTDCVFEPDKFQMQSTMLSKSRFQHQQPFQQKRQPLSKPLVLQKQFAPQDHIIVQKLQLRPQNEQLQQQSLLRRQVAQQPIPIPLRRMTAVHQMQGLPVGTSYALLAPPVPIQRHVLPNEIQHSNRS